MTPYRDQDFIESICDTVLCFLWFLVCTPFDLSIPFSCYFYLHSLLSLCSSWQQFLKSFSLIMQIPFKQILILFQLFLVSLPNLVPVLIPFLHHAQCACFSYLVTFPVILLFPFQTHIQLLFIPKLREGLE